MFTTTNAARVFSRLYRMGGQNGWYIPQLPGRPLSAGGCIIFRSLALIMPKRPIPPYVHGVLKARTHVSCVLYHGTLRASWCRMPLPPLSRTSTIGTMDIYISVNSRFILVQGESIHVWYVCFSNMRKCICIRVCLCIGTICDSVFRKKGPRAKRISNWYSSGSMVRFPRALRFSSATRYIIIP